jgi:ribose/xylose/arabinose/galactoside ABC-type transport system permease subunit
MGYSGSSSRSRTLNVNVLLLIVLGIASFFLTEQILTGWLPLGERINISRRDISLIEIGAGLAMVVWGVIVLRTAWGFLRHEKFASAEDYFENRAAMPPGILLTTAVLAIGGIISLFIAEQIITGWLPLSERINISRRDINWVEWVAIIGTLVWGGLSLRTVYGFVQRDRRAWSWGQWLVFLTTIIGLVMLLAGVVQIHKVIPDGGRLWQNLPGVQALTGPALLILLSAAVAYRYLAAELEQATTRAKKQISGTLRERAAARDVSRRAAPADQALRNTLAKSPGAGAIIGFIALFILFSISSDNLFLQPNSLAGAVTNNITRGTIAIGVTMLMIAGEFDLSVGSMFGVSGLAFLGLVTGQLPMTFVWIAVTALGATSFFSGLGQIRNFNRSIFVWIVTIVGALLLAASVYLIVQSAAEALPVNLPSLNPILAAIVALILTCYLGFLNGWILILTGIPSFIVTLGTLLAFRAIPLVLVAEGRILRYADYFNGPPIIAINRWLVIGLAIALTIGLLLIARTTVPGVWRSFRQRVAERTSPDASDFAELWVIFSFLYAILVTIATAAVLYLLAGSLLDQLGQTGSLLEISFFDLMNGRIAALPFIGELPRQITLRIGVFWWFVLVILFQFILTQTRYGNGTYAAGGNAGAARAQGINVNRIKISNYVVLALLVGTAAIMDVSYVQSVDALRGTGLELDVIAASVIGGALLTGGYGSIIGSLLGVLIFGMLQTGLVLVGMDPKVFNGVIGVIIIVAVVINTVSRRAKT